MAQIARDEACEILVKAIRLVGSACVGKRRAIAALAVRVERELAHYEHFAAHVCEAQVGLAILVFENAHFRDLAPQLVGLRLGVFVPDAEQNQESVVDGANRFAFDRHACVRDALHQSPHVMLLSRKARRAPARRRWFVYGGAIIRHRAAACGLAGARARQWQNCRCGGEGKCVAASMAAGPICLDEKQRD